MISLWNLPLSKYLLDHSGVVGDSSFEYKASSYVGMLNHCSAWWHLKGFAWMPQVQDSPTYLSFLISLEILFLPSSIDYRTGIFLLFAGFQENKAHQLNGNFCWLLYTTWSTNGADAIGPDVICVYCSPSLGNVAVFSESHQNLSFCPVWFC